MRNYRSFYRAIVFADCVVAMILAVWPSRAIAADVDDVSGLIVVAEAVRVQIPIDASERVADYGCRNSTLLNTTENNKRREIEDKTIGKQKFILGNSKEYFLSLLEARIDGSRLGLRFISKGLFEEYVAPVNLVVKKDVYGAEPVSTLLATAILAGIPLLLEPKEVAKSTFGCTDRESIDKYLDVENRRATGKRYWIDTARKAQLKIIGFSDIKSVFVDIDQTGAANVDLSQFILQDYVFGSDSLVVSCVDCAVTGKKIEGKRFESLVSVTVKDAGLLETHQRLKQEKQRRDEAQAELERIERQRIERQRDARRLESEFQRRRRQ